jgi:hypothetical protein
MQCEDRALCGVCSGVLPRSPSRRSSASVMATLCAVPQPRHPQLLVLTLTWRMNRITICDLHFVGAPGAGAGRRWRGWRGLGATFPCSMDTGPTPGSISRGATPPHRPRRDGALVVPLTDPARRTRRQPVGSARPQRCSGQPTASPCAQGAMVGGNSRDSAARCRSRPDGEVPPGGVVRRVVHPSDPHPTHPRRVAGHARVGLARPSLPFPVTLSALGRLVVAGRRPYPSEPLHGLSPTPAPTSQPTHPPPPEGGRGQPGELSPVIYLDANDTVEAAPRPSPPPPLHRPVGGWVVPIVNAADRTHRPTPIPTPKPPNIRLPVLATL